MDRGDIFRSSAAGRSLRSCLPRSLNRECVRENLRRLHTCLDRLQNSPTGSWTTAFFALDEPVTRYAAPVIRSFDGCCLLHEWCGYMEKTRANLGLAFHYTALCTKDADGSPVITNGLKVPREVEYRSLPIGRTPIHLKRLDR